MKVMKNKSWHDMKKMNKKWIKLKTKQKKFIQITNTAVVYLEQVEDDERTLKLLIFSKDATTQLIGMDTNCQDQYLTGNSPLTVVKWIMEALRISGKVN